MNENITCILCAGYSNNGWAFACYCEGKSCVVANGDYSAIKETANDSGKWAPENLSCQYSSAQCRCNLDDTECRKENKSFIRIGPLYPAQ